MYDLVRASTSARWAVANDVLYPDKVGSTYGTTSFVYDGETYTVENNKLYNSKHEVAVVYSPGYGGGWSTWYEVDATDARVAVLTLLSTEGMITLNLNGEPDEVYFKNGKFSVYGPDNFRNGLDIAWLPAGTLYQVHEYDGSETVVRNHDMTWHIA